MSEEKDRAIQLEIMRIQLQIAKNTQIDGSSMVITAILTALFLPMTFMAVYPLFSFYL